MQRDLAVRAREGDHDAFNALAAASIGRLYGIAALILRDRDLAEDATQEALVIAWRDIRGLREPDAIDAWLNRLVVRACYRQRKRERRHLAVVRVAPEHEPSAASHELSIAQRDQIDRGYARLDLDQRAVLVLYHHLGLPLSEVAETLAIPVGTAKSRLFRGHAAMRAALEADDRDAHVKTGAYGMNNDRPVRLFEAWLESEAPARAPDGLLDQIETTTGAMRPRPAWLARLEGHHMDMIEGGRRTGLPRLGLVLAIVALLAALAGAAIFVGGSKPLTVVNPPAPTAGPTPSPARTAQMRPIEPGEPIPEALIGDWVAHEFGEYAYYRRGGDPWCEYWGTTQDCVLWHDGEEVKGDANVVTLVDGQLRFVTVGTTFCAGEATLVDFVIEGDEVKLTVLPGQCFTDMSDLRRVGTGQVYPTLPPR